MVLRGENEILWDCEAVVFIRIMSLVVGVSQQIFFLSLMTILKQSHLDSLYIRKTFKLLMVNSTLSEMFFTQSSFQIAAIRTKPLRENQCKTKTNHENFMVLHPMCLFRLVLLGIETWHFATITQLVRIRWFMDGDNLEIKWSSFGKAVKVFLMAPGDSVQKAAQRLLSRPNV